MEAEIKESLSIRIASGGKMRASIDVALKSFKENPSRPVLLHTLPKASRISLQKSDASTDLIEEQEDIGETQKTVQLSASAASVNHALDASNHQPSAANIPRLITVAEIIKREYLKALPQALVKSGLHQYNRLGTLEGSERTSGSNSSETEQERISHILSALSGSNNIRIKRTPYAQTILSVDELQTLNKAVWTYQEPLTHKLSRSARFRLKRRQDDEKARAQGVDCVTMS